MKLAMDKSKFQTGTFTSARTAKREAQALLRPEKTMKSRFLLASLFVLSIILTAPPAQAQNFSVTATASADGSGESHTGPTSASAKGNYYNSAFSGDPTYPNVTSADVSIAGQQGLITGYASSSTYNYASSSASAKANWTDSLTVTSSSLSVGTPVQLMFLASYQATYQVGAYDPLVGGFPFATSTLDFETYVTDDATGASTPLVLQKMYSGYASTLYPSPQTDNMSLQATLNTNVGDTVNLNSLVAIESSSGVKVGIQSFKIQTYANSGGSFGLFVNAPSDVSIISASGHSYAAPTPAPASLPVFAVGMGALILSLRRRVRSQVFRE